METNKNINAHIARITTESPERWGIRMTQLLTQELQKARAHWLRSEIEKLERMLQNSNYPDDRIYNEPRRQEYGYNCAIHELITRYKEELQALTEHQ